MTVISEDLLRSLFRKAPFTKYEVEEGQILTPSAVQFLNERRVKIDRILKNQENNVGYAKPVNVPDSSGHIECQPRYVSAVEGGWFDSKPEHMTQLRGNRLVAKDHPRIIFRGKLDSFQSSILDVQVNADQLGNKGVVKDLDEVLTRIREIMKADVLEQPLDDNSIFGLTADMLRQFSHNPKKHFGIGHITPSYAMGRILLDLNSLRSFVREVEVAAVRAFRTEFEVERTDIIEALNRMSSALYIMMIKEKSGKYIEQKPSL